MAPDLSSPPRSPLALAGWTLALLVLLLAWDFSGADMALARWAGDASGFPLRDDWLLSSVIHEGGRRVSWLLAAALCVAVWWPFGILRRLSRPARLQLAASALLIALVVVLLKHFNPTSCPWELRAFGGTAEHLSHWLFQADGGSGHCFPAGHASSGFAFLPGYFAFKDTDARLARRWLLVAIVVGLLLGFTQQMRGAHFMSHTLWTGALAWLLAWALDYAPWSRLAQGQAE